MEAWLIACIVFVFACLIEWDISNDRFIGESDMTPTSIIGPGSQLVSRYTAILMKMKLRKLRTGKRKKDDYSLIDITFLIIFPIVFLVFNIIYWYFYISPSNNGSSHIFRADICHEYHDIYLWRKIVMWRNFSFPCMTLVGKLKISPHVKNF